MSMIEDPELRELFKVESEEHLQLLDSGLLHLEKNPDDSDRLHEVFREAHSLKGAARMLGVNDVETIAHLIEDILGSADKKQINLTPEKIETIYAGLDAIRKFVHEAVSGEPARLDPLEIIERLSGEAKGSRLAGIPQLAPQPAHQPDAETQRADGPEPVPVEPPAPARIEDVILEEDESTVLIDLVEPIQPATRTPVFSTPATPGPPLAPPAPQAPPTVAQAATPPPVTTATTAVLPAASPVQAPATSAPTEPPAMTRSPAVPASAVAGTTQTQIQTQTQTAQATTQSPPNAPATVSSGDQYRVDTIRVKPERLDALLTQAGELTVTRIRIGRRPLEIEALLSDLEELRRGMVDASVELNRAVKNEKHAPDEATLRGQELLHETQRRLEKIDQTMMRLRANAYEDGARLELISGRLEEGIRQIRMLPMSTVFGLFPRAVRDLAKEQSKQVELVVEGGETLADKRIIEEIKDPLMHMLRNAIDHGIETPAQRKQKGKPEEARLRLRAEGSARQIMIEVADDGRGLNTEAIKRKALQRGLRRLPELEEMSEEQIHQLIFAPGFSTSDIITDVSGRGVGMDVVLSKVEQLKGSIVLKSTPGQGTAIQLHLPITLSTTRVLLLRTAGNVYALPVDYVETSRMVPRSNIFALEGKNTCMLDSAPVSLVALQDLLPVHNSLEPQKMVEQALRDRFPVVFVRVGNDRVGLLVDELIDEQEIILKAQGSLLRRVPGMLGMTILESGAVCVVLNVQDLIKTVVTGALTSAAKLTAVEAPKKRIVLLVEDSITTRMQEKRILERAGYEVVLAVDGEDGKNKLDQNSVDAVVSDVEMPNMNGFALTRHIRAHAVHGNLPVILVTSLASEENIRKGMEAGANAYITKRAFDQTVLLETLERLL